MSPPPTCCRDEENPYCAHSPKTPSLLHALLHSNHIAPVSEAPPPSAPYTIQTTYSGEPGFSNIGENQDMLQFLLEGQRTYNVKFLQTTLGAYRYVYVSTEILSSRYMSCRFVPYSVWGSFRRELSWFLSELVSWCLMPCRFGPYSAPPPPFFFFLRGGGVSP